MAKARVYGMNRTYIPNSKADMRFKKNIYQRGRDIADRDDYHESRRAKREMRELERMKRGYEE